MNLLTVLSLFVSSIIAMQINACTRGSPLVVEKAILASLDQFDFEDCMKQAIVNGNVSIVRFLFNSGYYDFDHERTVAFARTISPISPNAMAVRSAIYDENIDRVCIFADDVQEDFLFACTFDNVRGLRTILSSPEKKAYIEKHADELAASLLEKLNENDKFLSPRMLYFMINNASCSDIVLRLEFYELVQNNLEKTCEFYHINYIHVLKHMLIKFEQ